MRKFLAACMAIVMIFTIAGCSSEGHEGEAKTPSGSSIQKGKDYQKVVDEFESSGFTNIKLEKLDDLVTGWLTKDGEVESVSVDGDTGYSADAWYPADVEVIITYHTFPEKETSKTDSESVSTEEPAVDILTVDNSPELAAILSLKADMDQSYADFAEAHKNQVIDEVFVRLAAAGLADTGSLSETKSQSIMIGDRKDDILGAKASGIDSMGVRYGFAEEQELEIAGADYIVETVEDIRGKLKTL